MILGTRSPSSKVSMLDSWGLPSCYRWLSSSRSSQELSSLCVCTPLYVLFSLLVYAVYVCTFVCTCVHVHVLGHAHGGWVSPLSALLFCSTLLQGLKLVILAGLSGQWTVDVGPSPLRNPTPAQYWHYTHLLTYPPFCMSYGYLNQGAHVCTATLYPPASSSFLIGTVVVLHEGLP